jgi:serine/threonine protein kinase
MQEFNILRRLRHRNVVRLYESFETIQHIVFVMEVCGGGELLTYVRRRRRLKEEVASFMFA